MILHFSKQIIVFYLLFGGSFMSVLSAQETDLFTDTFQSWDRNDGLPNWNIYNMFQDEQGMIWMGTNNSLVRFDGYEFEDYSVLIGGEGHINKLSEDKNHNIWLTIFKGANSKIKIFDKTTHQLLTLGTYLNRPELDNDKNWTMTNCKKEIWLWNNDYELFYFDGEKLQEISNLDIHASQIQHVFKTKTNQWLGIWYHRLDDINIQYVLTIFDEKGKVFHTHTLDVPFSKSIQFFQKNDETLQIVYSPKFNANSLTKDFYCEVFDLTIPDFHIRAVKDESPTSGNNNQDFNQYSHPSLLINEQGIVFTLISKLPFFYYKGKLLSHISEQVSNIVKRESTFNACFVDKVGNFWFNSNSKLYKLELRANPFQHYLNQPAAFSTRGIQSADNGELYINSYAGAKYINTLKNEILPFEDKRVSTALGLYKESDQLWFGTHGNDVIRWKNEQFEGFNYGDKSQINAYAFLRKSENRLWVGTSNGLYELRDNMPAMQFLALPNIYIYFLTQVKEGVWAATDKGLVLFDDNGKVAEIYLEEVFENWEIKHFHIDDNGDFWLATTIGLVFWNRKNNETTRYSTKNGFSNDNIHAVYEDEEGFLWLPSNHGLMRFDKREKTVRSFFEKDGLTFNEFNFLSHHRANDGRLFFGGMKGVNAFYPKVVNEMEDAHNLTLAIHQITVTNGKTGETKDLDLSDWGKQNFDLSTNENFLTLKVTPFVFEKNPDLELGWRTQETQQNWVIQKDRTIQINNLAYGKNPIEIRIRRLGNNWSRHTLNLNFNRAKPFYLQEWFLISGLFLVVSGIYLFIKRREKLLQEEKIRLEKLVTERTVKIQNQAEKLKELNEVKSRFFSNITHEFRTPLTLIIGPLEQFLTEQKSKKLSIVLQNAKQLQLLINQLLDISKLENQKMSVETQRGDIVEYTEDLVKQFQEFATLKKQNIIFHTPLENWETHFDTDKWNKIIYNLISNAVKFTPENGSIQVGLAILRASDKNWITLSVQDNGKGISPEKLPYIFDRFYQVDGASTREAEGTGIGLALVKELVEVQNGTIEVASEVGKGTLFKIQLPVLNFPINEAQGSVEVAELPLFDTNIPEEKVELKPDVGDSSLEVLIIEDNTDMREYIRSCIEHLGHKIREAKDGQVGLEMALETIPDLIISDVMMPRKNGFEVTSAIRNDRRTSHIPIVLLTAKASLESRLEGFERGADAYLSKPFSPQELVIRIKNLMELRKSIQKYFKADVMGISHANKTEKPELKTENEFVQQVEKMILANLKNEALNGDYLAQKHFMSKGHFYRKIKALTTLTPHQYINAVRIREAIPLLQRKEMNMAEIAFEVGFTSPSYFTRVFKQIHGHPPSEFVND
jgi:signal transduction histidine kinase/DNA-binding response OmpR family regulator/ligand-binding sensor domain-containing protein